MNSPLLLFEYVLKMNPFLLFGQESVMNVFLLLL